jgi:hypothetical protein
MADHYAVRMREFKMIDELGVAHAQSVVIDEINLMTGIDKGPPDENKP